MQNEYQAVQTELPSVLIDVVQMTKCSIKLEKHLRGSDRELQKTQHELQVANVAVLKAQHFVLSKSNEVCSFRQQLQVVEKQMDLAFENVTSGEVASAKLAVQSKRGLVRLQKE